MSELEKIKILVVDDEKVLRAFLSRFLRMLSLDAEVVADGAAAVEAAKKERFDLVFLDIKMPGMDGLQTFKKLRQINPDFTCVFMTGYALEEYLLEVTKQPQTVFIRKPFEDLHLLKEIIEGILKKIGQQHKAPVSAQQAPLPADRRMFARLDTTLEVNYRLSQGSAPFKSAVGQNITADGIMLFLQEKIAGGTPLDLSLKAAGCKEACGAKGVVLWNKEDKTKAGYYYTGVQFTAIDVEGLTKLLVRSGQILPPDLKKS